MNITVSTVEAQKGFYPTPPELALKLIDGINWNWSDKLHRYPICTVLEPSAGNGNLVSALAQSLREYRNGPSIEVDMIEIDPAIRGILSDRFSEEARRAAYRHSEDLRDAYLKKSYANEEKEQEYKAWQEAADACRGLDNITTTIVHDNFLTFNSRKQYDLIIMNPPFADGDAHLLKAIQMQERYGGQIRCILNAETLQNPYTNRRKCLVQKLQQLGAEISFKQNAFADAERHASVDVAIIKIDIPMPVYDSDIMAKLKLAKDIHDPQPKDPTELVENNFVKQIIKQYELEVDAGCELIRQYIAVTPYIRSGHNEDDKPIIRLAVDSDHADYGLPSVNTYMKAVRKKYWKTLFQHPSFTRQLTSNLSNELYGRVNEMVAYDFTEYNIRTLMAEVTAKIVDGVKQSILQLFETMTAKHAYYPECQGNIHYYNGWCSNKAHKINPKVILPVSGIFNVHSWTGDVFNTYNAYSVPSDIELALNYLDGCLTAPVNLERQLRIANSVGMTKNIQLKYFDVTFYKKGTMHIKFTCPDLLDRFNIYCAREKNWLPPCYGRTAYTDMKPDERDVVDGFHGDGTDGSGEPGYASVMARPGYFLAPPNCQQIALEEGDTCEV